MRILAVLGWLWLTALIVLSLAQFPVRRHHFESAGIAFGSALFALAVLRSGNRVVSTDGAAVRVLSWSVPPVVGMAVFAWCLQLGPLSDDFILHRWAETGDTQGWPYMRPIPLLIWRGVIALGGSWTSLHALNVIVHGLNSALVARIGSAVAGPRAGLASGILFAVFPASSEAVAWTAGVFDVVSTFFILLAVTLWLLPRAKRPVLALLPVLCVAALLSKESAVILPVLLIAMLFALRRSTSLPDVYRRSGLVLVLIVSTVYFLARLASSETVYAHTRALPSTRLEWKELLVRPFIGTFVPYRTDQGVNNDIYLSALAALVLLLIAARVALAADRDESRSASASLALIGLCWTALSAFPLLLQFHVSNSLEGSRYLYLPAVGFAFSLGAAVAPSLGRPASILAAAALGCLLITSALRLGEERRVWFQAAGIRDDFLTQAAVAALKSNCRTVDIAGAPDNFRGAYVFRNGLTDAMKELPLDPKGVTCRWSWESAFLKYE